MTAIAAIDMALRDIKGVSTGQQARRRNHVEPVIVDARFVTPSPCNRYGRQSGQKRAKQ
jgi:hypothetical protein